MSEDHPKREPGSDTQEFEAISHYEKVKARTELELIGNHRLFVTPDFRHPVELRLGRDERTRPATSFRSPGTASTTTNS